MGRLMGSSNSNNYGEQIFINKASEYLDDTNIIYWNRQLFGKEFDVCILMPEKGILVVELKGWREENILRIENNDSVIIQTNDGEVSASPQKQARGYRFSIERHIRQNISKFPLVYQMVCLPQVSKAFFKSHRLDVVMEEKFTILKEDLKDNTSFFNKLDQALREVCHWNRDPFDRRTMLEVRNLFETDINVDEDGESEIEKELASSYHRHDYSRFYYFNEFDQMSGNTINDMVAQYLHGCKLYCVFSKKAQMLAVIKALDTALTQRRLVRNRDNIEIAFDEQKSHTPLAESVGDMFMGFHCSMSVLSAPFDKNTTSFAIPNGSYSSAQKRILEKLSEQSQFNFEQYQVEHATPEKNIVIRAGAGTGKTYTMISRIGFICYTQNVPLQKMADRIVMITFTNEAADQMEEKLKAYFKNCYLVTSKPDYLQMISQIDHMQISTIHSYAKNLIAQMGTSFGYGIDLSITSSEFYRRKKISDLLDAYIYQKEMEQGKNYTDKLGMPVYAIRDSILDFIGELTKGIKYDRFQMMDMFLCPYRFFLDYVMENSPVVQGNFLYQKYFENLLIEAVWKRVGKHKRSDAMKYLSKILEQEAQKLEPFFKFWKATEIFDLKARARNYLVHEVITNGSGLFVKPYDSEHMNMRKHFGAALFAVDVSEVERKNPYQEFEALVRRDGWNKIYSLHRLPLPGNQEKADILRNETKLYLNQACRKDKTAIPSDWCIYCVHRENCMESFLRSEVGMSSSRNEPCINRSVRANAPAKTTLPPVCEQEIIDVEAVPAEPIVPATASIIDTAPAVEAPIVETPVVDVPTVEAPASEVVFVESPAAEVPTHVDTPKSPELSIFEQMFRQIQEMVEGNRQEIQSLKGELAARQSRREDTTRIQARLEDEEHRSQELLDKLAETESRLATSEAQVKKQRELEFTESELAELRKYSTIIVFDTCSIMNCPNLLDGVNDGELVVVPKDVNNELEHHKTRFGADDRKFKAQKAITAIFNYKRRFPLAYADGLPSLVPEAYRAKADEKEQNDNKILAVALRYKIYTDIPVLFITDDRSLSNKASGEGLDVWTSKDFLAPPETSFDD